MEEVSECRHENRKLKKGRNKEGINESKEREKGKENAKEND